MGNLHGKFAIAFLCMLVSFGVTLQLNNAEALSEEQLTSTARAEQLQEDLTDERAKSEALYKQIIGYKDEIAAITEDAKESGGYATLLANELEKAEIVAGLTDVEGPGLIVTMNDSKAENIGVDENFFIIHDEDILRLINELRDAGAEALSINGERILATSEIRCAGATVSVNNTRYSVPYVIKAIGDPDEMEGALTMRQGVVDILSQWGIEIEIEQSDNITIEAYSGVTEFKHAQTTEE